MSINKYVDQINAARDYVKSRYQDNISLALVLGTGLAGFEDKLKDSIEISYADIPDYPRSTAPSHAGKLIIGKLGVIHVICFSGRLHWYEGYSMKSVTFPIRLVGALGIPKLIVTNASGGINETFNQGDFVFIKDHINLFPDNPLRGENHEPWGSRFPDMSRAYDEDGLNTARHVCDRLDLEYKTGVYCGFPGPNLETPAEYSYLHHIGGDMVGMSTVPEVLVARHMGIAVMGISLVTNACYPPERIVETTVEDVIAMAASRQPVFMELVEEIIARWT